MPVSHVRREFLFRRQPLRGPLLAGLFAALSAAPAAADSTLSVSDARVGAGDGAPLSFVIERTGDTSEGVRVLVETVPGGSNPATDQQYAPIPAGTAVTLPPGASSATVEVDVTGAVESADRTLLLRLSSAHAYSPEAELASSGLTFSIAGSYPAALAVADLDGDGDLDIVLGNDLSLSLSVILADGAGGFAEPVAYPILDPAVFVYSVNIAVGDVTGDGVPDVIAAGFNPALAYLFAGDGAGGLAEPTTIALDAADTASALALGDVDGDGDADLVASLGATAQVSVLRNDGAGGFAAGELLATGVGPIAVEVADADGDDLLDIVTANDSGDVSLLAGEGGGSFAAARSIDIGADEQPVSLAVKDVNGDGNVDIVTANRYALSIVAPGSVSIAAGDGAGGFAEPVEIALGDRSDETAADPPGLLTVGDVNADGRADILVTLAVGNAVVVLAGQEGGGFADLTKVAVAKGPLPVAVADVTGDDEADIITGNALDDSISILPGDSAGHVGFQSVADAGQYPHSIATADLDGDGDADLATANLFSNDVSVILSDGAGGLVKAGDFPVGSFPTWVAAADLDDDGAVDLVTANGTGSVSVLLGDGAGGFAGAVDFAAGDRESPYAVAIGDLDGDGALDIVTANTNVDNDGMSVLLGDGAGGFGAPAVFEVSDQPYNDPRSVALADVNGDGKLDAITANSSNTLSVLAGDGAGGFAAPVGVAAGLGPVGVAAADVTGDGHIDLVALNHPGQSVSVLAGDGAGAFAEPVDFPIFEGPSDLCTFDVNLPCPWAWGLAVGDADGDGDLDVVTANTNTDTVSILSNDGHGDLSALELFYTGAHPGSVVVADVTGDGNPDVITANRENNNVAVLSSRLGSVEIADGEAVGTITPGSPDGEGDDGCGCSARGPSSSAPGAALLFLAALISRRRRRRAD